MKTGILLLLLNVLVLSTFAQGTAPFQKEDAAAIEITPAIEKKLTQEVWRCYDRVFVDREGYTSKEGMPRLFLKGDGTFTQGNIHGTWTIEGKNILKINPKKNKGHRYGREVLEGGYAIYNIDQHHMTLAKVLTTSSDMMIAYHFESETGRMTRLEKEWNRESYEEKKDRLKKESSETMSDNIELEKEEKIIFNNKKTKNSSENKVQKTGANDTSKMSKEERFMRGLKPEKAEENR